MESPHQHPVQGEDRETQTYDPQSWTEANHPRDALAEEMESHHQLEKEHSSTTRTSSYDRNHLPTSAIPHTVHSSFKVEMATFKGPVGKG